MAKLDKAILALRDALQAGIQKHGNSYLQAVRRADAGIYSLRNIDNQVELLREDIAFISELLVTEAKPGELAQPQAVEFPTRLT